jgi:hypothetical protein
MVNSEWSMQARHFAEAERYAGYQRAKKDATIDLM